MARHGKLQVRAGGAVGGVQHVQVRGGDGEGRGGGPAQLLRPAHAALPPALHPALDLRLPPPDRPLQAPHRQQEPRLRPGRPRAQLGRPDHPDGAALLRGELDGADCAGPAMVEPAGDGGHRAPPPRPRGVPLLLVPPGAAPPLPLLAVPLAPPRVHRDRARHLRHPPVRGGGRLLRPLRHPAPLHDGHRHRLRRHGQRLPHLHRLHELPRPLQLRARPQAPLRPLPAAQVPHVHPIVPFAAPHTVQDQLLAVRALLRLRVRHHGQVERRPVRAHAARPGGGPRRRPPHPPHHAGLPPPPPPRLRLPRLRAAPLVLVGGGIGAGNGGAAARRAGLAAGQDGFPVRGQQDVQAQHRDMGRPEIHLPVHVEEGWARGEPGGGAGGGGRGGKRRRRAHAGAPEPGVRAEPERGAVRDQEAWPEDQDRRRHQPGRRRRAPHGPPGRQGRAPPGEGEQGRVRAGPGPLRERHSGSAGGRGSARGFEAADQPGAAGPPGSVMQLQQQGVAGRRWADGAGAAEGGAGHPLRALLPAPTQRRRRPRRLRVPQHPGARGAGVVREPPRLRELAAEAGDERVARGGDRARAGEVARPRVRRRGHRRRQGVACRPGARIPPLRRRRGPPRGRSSQARPSARRCQLN